MAKTGRGLAEHNNSCYIAANAENTRKTGCNKET